VPASETSPLRRDKPVDAEHFRLLVESVKDYAIFMLTPEGHVATWNRGAAAIKGYAAEEIIGQHFSRFYEPEAIARGWPDHELTLAKLNGRFEDEGWRLRKDGTRFWASVVISPLYSPAGELQGFAKVTRDLTARLKFEDLQRSERRTNEFLAMLAHELRNPLAPMQTMLDLALMPGAHVDVQGTLAVFQRQVSHLTRMVNDLLDVGRVTTGKLELHFEPTDLNDVVNESAQTFAAVFDRKKQSLTLDLPPEGTPVLVDRTRLAQVVSNLLANANKFTEEGGHVSISVRKEKGNALLEMTDDGRGIEPHFLSLIFEPFVQGQPATLHRTSGGLGLGLTLVKRIVELHGGTIAAVSPGAGQGSKFSVRLPLHEAPLARPHVVVPAPKTRSLRVLVVDDNEEIAGALAMLVRSLGHQVDVAHDGVKALVQAAAFQAEVVLLDIGLPHMNGFDVARALRTLPAMQGTTIVACTGYGGEADKEQSVKAGFDSHLIKPVRIDQLLAVFASADARIAGTQRSAKR